MYDCFLNFELNLLPQKLINKCGFTFHILDFLKYLNVLGNAVHLIQKWMVKSTKTILKQKSKKQPYELGKLRVSSKGAAYQIICNIFGNFLSASSTFSTLSDFSSIFSTLSDTFSTFSTLDHTFSTFSTLSNAFSSLNTLSHTFSTFSSLNFLFFHTLFKIQLLSAALPH